jgi:4-hydroxymandelate oxidase
MDKLATPVLVNVADYGRLARRALPADVWDFIAGGSGGQLTMRANRRAFAATALRPRVLVDVSRRMTGTVMLGTEVAAPIAVAPMAYHRLAHPDGEVATARAAAASGLITVVSSFASRTIEDVAAAAAGPLWFQLYCFRDRGVMTDLVRRAEAAGYRALVLTVDMPMMGRREADARNGFTLPAHVTPVNLTASGPGQAAGRPNVAELTRQLLDDGVTWELVQWLRGITELPLVLKGILADEDAALAVDLGAAGVIVSNHGGRQLDGAVAALRALPDVVDRVGPACEVYVDGGVRRGTDVLKALALGARAVLVGRPVLWGLAAAGEPGVRDVLRIMRDELDLAMGLAGCPTVASIGAAAAAELWSR